MTHRVLNMHKAKSNMNVQHSVGSNTNNAWTPPLAVHSRHVATKPLWWWGGWAHWIVFMTSLYMYIYVYIYIYTHIIFVIYISYILYIANVIHKVYLTLLTYSNLLNSPYLINNYISLPFPYCIPLPFSKLCFPQPPKKKGYWTFIKLL